MKTRHLISFLLLFATAARAANDTPVPAEVQKLAESLVAAIKGNDDKAVLDCWHSPEVLAKARQRQKLAEATANGKSKTDEELAKYAERELENRAKENEDTTERVERLRRFLAKHFGPISGIKIHSVELDVDKDAPPEQPQYDDFDLLLETADGNLLSIDVDDLVKIDGVWKFAGRLDDDITIELSKRN
jgi:hypothetical protein